MNLWQNREYFTALRSDRHHNFLLIFDSAVTIIALMCIQTVETVYLPLKALERRFRTSDYISKQFLIQIK